VPNVISELIERGLSVLAADGCFNWLPNGQRHLSLVKAAARLHARGRSQPNLRAGSGLSAAITLRYVAADRAATISWMNCIFATAFKAA
jgi:hypothetical protein